MRIRVKLAASQNTSHETFDLEDLNCTLEEWNAMSEEDKNDLLQESANELREQPYWCVDSFDESI